DIDIHDSRVYEKGKENLQNLISRRILIEDPVPSLYVYAQTMGERTQYGLVGCASVEEYWNEIIKKHEFTRKDKEEDRCRHVNITNAHSGPVFLTYRDNEEINAIVSRIIKSSPINDHIAADGIRHQSWVIDEKAAIERIVEIFRTIPNLYIADGHHRSAAAATVGRDRAKANPYHRGDEEYNFYLAVYFPANQLRIMDYNRVVKDLNGLTGEEFFSRIKRNFSAAKSAVPVKPVKKGDFGMYIDSAWYTLTAEPSLQKINDSVKRLDVSILQDYLLDPILGVKDPRTDRRIDFVGGIRGLNELERRVNSGEMKIAFSMYPTSLDELMAIADDGKVMPPKSTWFEPKLRDGLFVHFLD
ncbi:MAG: DUF1015 domain-containing protein, partial [Bacteroidetes bacterium]|nr:DUF1015 domain-containing protein [Bacteroidota bacterium]